MKKFFISIFFIILITLTSAILYLSYFGYQTDKFNNIVKSEINKKNKNFNLEFEKVLVKLNIKELTLFIKFISPKIEYQLLNIPLESLRSNINLVSLIKDEIAIKNVIIKTHYLDFRLIKPKILELEAISFDKNILDFVKRSKIKINANFSFDRDYKINKNFTINGFIKDTNLQIDTNHKISDLKFNFSYNKKKLKIKNMSSRYKNIKLNDGKIVFYEVKNGTGLIFDTKIIFQKEYEFSTLIKKTLNKGDKFNLNTDLIYKNNQSILIKDFVLKNDNNLFKINQLSLNKKFKLINFKSIKIKTQENNNTNNDFIIDNKKKIFVNGNIFDATNLLKELDKSKSDNDFLNNITKNIEVDFKKILTNTELPLNKFRMVGQIKKGKLEKISAKSEFKDNKYLDISLEKEKNSNLKVLEIYSDVARPLINSYKFFDGLKDGKLIYESKFDDKNSSSVLRVNDFKLIKAPAFAKLLSLADLQGLTDTLKGEGISFDTLVIKYTNDPKIMKIKEIFMIGPSISILIDGYVENESGLISLRGTLVPAKTLNTMLSKIPVLGNILIGKKDGEGLFGVSFKIKGLPENLKTTVNPVKTLTPRFITRALESIKNKNKIK